MHALAERLAADDGQSEQFEHFSLGKIAHLHPMRSHQVADEMHVPRPVILERARILQPGNTAVLGTAPKHAIAVIVRDDEVVPTAAGNVTHVDRHWQGWQGEFSDRSLPPSGVFVPHNLPDRQTRGHQIQLAVAIDVDGMNSVAVVLLVREGYLLEERKLNLSVVQIAKWVGLGAAHCDASLIRLSGSVALQPTSLTPTPRERPRLPGSARHSVLAQLFAKITPLTPTIAVAEGDRRRCAVRSM